MHAKSIPDRFSIVTIGNVPAAPVKCRPDLNDPERSKMASLARENDLRGSHRAVVDGLARELELPVEEVESVYFSEVTRLEKSARVKTFVSVLAAGSARMRLRHRA